MVQWLELIVIMHLEKQHRVIEYERTRSAGELGPQENSVPRRTRSAKVS